MALLLAFGLGLSHCGGGQGGAGASAPVITGFSAQPALVTAGHPSTLSWSVSGADTVVLDSGVGTVSGTSLQVHPATTTTYTLTASGAGGTIQGTATVSVVPPPIISSLTATPSALPTGSSGQLTPVFSGGSGVIEAGIGPVISGVPVATGPLAASETFHLTVTNPAGDSATAAATVTVGPAVAITGLTAAKMILTAGASTTLTPVFVNATGAALDQGIGPVASGIPVVIAPSATTTYTLTVSGLGGPVTQALTVVVVPLPSIASFSATPASVATGSGSQLMAVFSGGTGSLDHGLGPVTSGVPTATGALEASTTFQLTVTNPAGDEVSALATVAAGPAVAITRFTAAKSVITAGTGTSLTPVFVNESWASIDHGLGSVASGVPLPVAPAVTTTYTLTVGGPGGPVTQTLTVTVVPPPSISGFTASPGAVVAGTGSQLTATFSGGEGVIDNGIGPVTSGVPVGTGALSADTNFQLTVTNPAGDSATLAVGVAVTAAPPANLTYDTMSAVFPIGTDIGVIWPSFSGGSPDAWDVTPSLPPGLWLDPDFGEIVGFTTGLSPTTVYTVTATNTGGSASCQLTFTVIDLPPVVTYGGGYTFDLGRAVPKVMPGSTGGAVVAWSILPTLPTGLVFNPADGTITGTPSATSASQSYTVTATNSGGTTTATFMLAVKNDPPAIAYGGPYSYTVGQAVPRVQPTNSGGVVVSWSIGPSLPAGLDFDATDGSFSGTPSAIAASQTYTVTATNAAGPAGATFTLAVNPPPPSILSGPADATADIGATATFSVSAHGTGALSYQWSKDGTPIVGATSSSYTTPNLAYSDNQGRYAVTVQDGYGGRTTSDAAVLTVRSVVATWLQAHPQVAAAIKWQFRPADLTNSYIPPAETDKVAWSSWSASQQADLEQAYLDLVAWQAAGGAQVTMATGGLSPTDQPDNLHPNVSSDTVTTLEWVSPAYMWRLYIAHVAFSLWVEITGQVPWSLTTYDDTGLRYLFDSSTMAWHLPSGNFSLGTYGGAWLPTLRANNLPRTSFADPRWTYPFLQGAGILQGTRLETIGKVLDWMRGNMVHFFGAENFGNCEAIWQYRGYAPVSKIVSGTVDSHNPSYGVQHWTEGCHGSVGFIQALLRTANVPVQPVWVDGHELACFLTERLYLDHGDDPYNTNVKAAAAPSLDLLIDEATYQSWFTPDLTKNITNGTGLANVGRRAAELK